MSEPLNLSLSLPHSLLVGATVSSCLAIELAPLRVGHGWSTTPQASCAAVLLEPNCCADAIVPDARNMVSRERGAERRGQWSS